MKKYLELFKNGFDETINEKVQPEKWPYVGHDVVTGEIVYTIIPEPNWVTFTAEEDNSSVGLEKLSTNHILKYSTNAYNWNVFDTSTNISLNNGDKIYIRGILSANNTSSNYTQFKMSGKIAASGNCNAIWNYQDLNAPLKNYCGHHMFSYCTALTTAPELPATTLATQCYNRMFSHCTSLTVAPELPATVLGESCYAYMFYRCESLTKAPELPATELAVNCYASIFSYCTSLTTAPEILPATVLADYCYSRMFWGCTSLTITPKLPATELAAYCYESMFCNCSSLMTAPELPAAVLADYCYDHMFYGCTFLNHITCLATNILASQCTWYWVDGVASTGTFVKHPDMKNWTTRASGIPSGWTVVNAEL